MPIEPMQAGMSPTPEMEMEEEVAAPAPEGETAVISMEMLGGQKVAPGQTIRLEVVSASDEDGTVVVRYPQTKASKGGIAEAAAVFDEKGVV